MVGSALFLWATVICLIGLERRLDTLTRAQRRVLAEEKARRERLRLRNRTSFIFDNVKWRRKNGSTLGK